MSNSEYWVEMLYYLLIKLDTEEKPSRPIPTLKMKIDDN